MGNSVTARSSQTRRKANEFSGFIIVRLKDTIEPVDNAETLRDLAKTRNLQGVLSVLEMLGEPKTKRSVWSLPVSTIRELERRAANTQWKPKYSLASYWRIDVRADWDQANSALKRLNDLPKEVDFAYKELAASSPIAVDPVGDSLFSRQGYLSPGPVGIGAQTLWNLGAKGSGVGFADLEMGWYLGHEDLPSSLSVVFGDNFEADADHGTCVLGIVLGKDSPPVAGRSGRLTGGIVGIAPGTSSVQLASRYHAAEDSAAEVACAIGKVIPLLNAGDVLLLEVQKAFKPTEVEDVDFDAIKLAVSKGIIVVEAAGNGGMNLDTISNAKGDRTLNNSPASDSGAIMVGAARQIVEQVSVSGILEGRHSRIPSSNFGARVNCYAWGEGIMTTTATYGDSVVETEDQFASRYAGLFGGTSGASAIIAGAAVLLQSWHKANKAGAMLTNDTPQTMRSMLSRPDIGTRQKFMPSAGLSDPIGVMPNLSRIIANLVAGA